jgi:death-on-curing protein
VNWRWIDRRALELLHDESLAEHGGASGLRDEGLLESALARPLNLAAYEQPDVAGVSGATERTKQLGLCHCKSGRTHRSAE